MRLGPRLVGQPASLARLGIQRRTSPVVTYVLDDFANGSDVTITGWAPDIGAPWVQNTGGATTGTVKGGGSYVTGTSASGHYSINPVTIADANYVVRAGLKRDSGTPLPGLLVGFASGATVTGYRAYYDDSSVAFIIQRLVAGASTILLSSPDPAWGTIAHIISFARFVLSDRVRLRVIDETTGQVFVTDDTSGSRITAINYPGIGYRLNARINGPFTATSLLTPVVGTSIVSDGVRTWFNDPVSLVDGSTLYLGSVGSAGDVQVTKRAAGVNTTTVLHAALQVDDHNEASLVKLPGGRVAAFFAEHSADNFMRYRVSTNALPDISAFNTEVTIDNSNPVSYSLPFLLSDGYLRVFYRNGNGAQRERKMFKALATDVEAGTATWTITNIFQTVGQRPYMCACQNGTDRIDFLMTNGHPDEVATSIYHCYMRLVGGVEHFYKSDGTEIVGLPTDVAASCTLIDDTTGGRCWNWKIAIGPDGYPRALFTKYPTGVTTPTAMYQDIEYWHARWTGSAWVKTRLLTGQISLYVAQPSYVGGMCFDGNDVGTLYIAEIVSGIYEIRKYSFNETTGAKTLISNITANSSAHNFRPVSPVGASRPTAVTWASGPYTSYTSFGTSIFGDA